MATRSPYPFTWATFERETGAELAPGVRARLQRVGREPTPHNWRTARSIVVAPQMSILGQTLWQCVEAVSLSKYPDERTPEQFVIIRAMCFAAGLPFPSVIRR